MKDVKEILAQMTLEEKAATVSYTHLTLPTMAVV